MTAIDRDRARAAFKSYTDAYDATNHASRSKSSIRTRGRGMRCRSARAGLVVRRY